jgi:hypothetical protein
VTSAPGWAFFVIHNLKGGNFQWQKHRLKAGKQAAPEKTAEQNPVNFVVRIFNAKSTAPSVHSQRQH